MNIVISKLDLPCDIKYIVNNFCYNNQGFNIHQITCIEKEKKKNKTNFLKLRHKLELMEWYRLGVSVTWLKPDGVYGKKNPNSVYGGGTLAESQYFRYYNGITSYCPTIKSKNNNYIQNGISKGDEYRQI